MSGNPSFYFTLFKKFQVLNHVPSAAVHGAPAPTGNFNLSDPNAPNGVFGTSNSGKPLTIPDTTKAHSPLWAILNNKAAGGADYSLVAISGGAQNGTMWPTMPPGAPPAWTNFQVNASVKLVDVFGNWIAAGQQNDVPSNPAGGVIGQIPPPIAAPLDSGVSLFVCSMPGDVGIRPDAVPSDFYTTSLIYLLDPSNGNIANPATLDAGAEWYLAAIIGNRGNTDAGNYLNPPGIETAAVVMVFGTTVSPGVELPSLSNLDVTDTNPIFEQYFLKSATYDIVGFRMNVQTVFDGIVAALNQAVANGQINLGGLTAVPWLHAGGAHLCAKVLIRQQGGVFPNVGDSPITNPHLAQKNLVPFNINVQEVSPNPKIVWKTFVSGQPFFFRLPGAGGNRLILQVPQLPKGAFRFFIGIPTVTFNRFFSHGKGIKGFRMLTPKELCESPLGVKAKPFPEAVVLQLEAADNHIEFPALLEQEFLGMALGIEWDVRHVKPGALGRIQLIHRANLTKLEPGTRCFNVEDTVAGGFAIDLGAVDPFAGPKGQKIPFEIPGRQ